MAARAVNGAIIAQLVAILAPLSLVAVGGGNTVIPEVYRQVVEVHGWLTDAEFAELFALAQAAPGPNILVVSLIGSKIAGWTGAVAALLAIIGPSSALTFGMVRAWDHLGRPTWLMVIQAGLAPVAVGLMLASGVVLTGAADTTPLAYLVTAATVILVLRTRLHPLILMLAAAGLAVAGWL